MLIFGSSDPRIEYTEIPGIGYHNAPRRSRSAFPITDTEPKVMAALAIIGLNSKPTRGQRGIRPQRPEARRLRCR